jgi:ABC-type multidrug transport system ATPase subunit
MSRIRASRAQFSTGASRGLVVGRTHPADMVLPYNMISGRHLELRGDRTGFRVKDLGSTNGTTLNGALVGDWTPLTGDDVLAMGSYQVPRYMLEHWFASLGRPTSIQESSAVSIPKDGRITLGRDPDCEVTIDATQVSWHHAQIVSKNGHWVVRDLKSSNGVFVNGSRVKQAALKPDDELSLGSHRVQLRGDQLAAAPAMGDGVRLDATGVTRVVPTSAGPLTILEDVSVSIYPGEMVALMGPSGAGKSTLLEVLTGQRRPNNGRVLFNGQCLHSHFQSLKDHIGYVPQDDIMHRDLTVFEVLFHAARSWDSKRPHHAIEKDVYNVLASMGLSHIAESLIGGTATIRGISGGQRKRVNIAMELLKSPKLLFLDEPTSGLDARATMEVIQLLKELAANGTTIVMTIHQPRVEAFRLMTHLLLLTKGGKLAYFGEADPGAAAYFEKHSSLTRHPGGNPADYVIDVLDPEGDGDKRSTTAWQQDYIQSGERNRFVAQRQGSANESSAGIQRQGLGRRNVSKIDAFISLTSRYARRKLRDRTALGIQIAQAPIVAILLGWLFFNAPAISVTPTPKFVPGSGGVHQVLFLLSAAAFWFGCSNVAREIVAERSVFRRERRAGLSVGAYLMSLFTVQFAISALQISVLTVLTWILVRLEFESLVLSLPLLLLTAMAGVSLGFLVSAVASTEVAALSVIPLILLPQLMFSGYLKLYRVMSDDSMLQAIVAALTPMRWCFQGLLFFEFEFDEDASKGPLDAHEIIERTYGFEPFEDWPVEFCSDAAVLLAFTGVFAILTYVRLARMGQSSN